METPNVVVLGGPNGAGKSTIAKKAIRDGLGVLHYVNADTLGRGLSEFDSESMALKAGRIMLEHLKDLAKQRTDFAFETTLASKTFAPWIRTLKEAGYKFHLLYLWLPSPDMAVDRVSDRVQRGGHNIPEETIRRRYQRGLDNFFGLYAPMADFFRFFDNSNRDEPRIIAEKRDTILTVEDVPLWETIQKAVQQ